MVVREAGGDFVGHVNRRPRLEERGFLTPRVMVLEATGPDGPVDVLHITDPRSLGGADYDAALPDGTPVARITGIWRWFRLNLAIRAEAGDLLADADRGCSLVHVFRDVGQPAKKAGEGPMVASMPGSTGRWRFWMPARTLRRPLPAKTSCRSSWATTTSWARATASFSPGWSPPNANKPS